MKDRMERIVVLPFTAGCVSSSSVAVCVQQPRRSKQDLNSSQTVSSPLQISKDTKEEEEGKIPSDNMKSSFRFLQAIPKPNISIGFQRLSKSFKSFSQLFVSKEELQEVEMDIQIGHPTDVKHVTHIGLDGSATTNPIAGCVDNLIPSEFLSLRPISLTQFELAMSAQSDAFHMY